MLALTSVRTVDNLFVPGNGEEVYDTVSGLIYRGNGYLPVGQLSPIQSVQQGLYIPGVAGNYVSSPDANIFDVPGDLCVVACIQGPNSGADAKFILSKWAPSNDTFYFYYQISTQQLVLTWSSDGATANYKISNQISITNKKWVAITFDVNNGSGGNTAIFWISPDGINWTPFSSDVAAGLASLFVGVADVEIGAFAFGGGGNFEGIIYEVRYYNGIGANTQPGQGTLVGKWVASAGSPQVDPLGNIWTVNGSGVAWQNTPTLPITYLDNFDRPNSATLGAKWVKETTNNNGRINNNKLSSSVNGGAANEFWTAPLGTDHYLEVDLVGAGDMSVFFRCVTPGPVQPTCYEGYWETTNGGQLVVRYGGQNRITKVGIPNPTGKRIRWEIRGTTVSCFINDILQLTGIVTDTFAGQYVGLRTDWMTSEFDNFKCGSL